MCSISFQTVSEGVRISGTNVHATAEADEVVLANGTSTSVWFAWVAAETGPLSVTTAGSDFDTVLGVYSSSEPIDQSSLDTITLVRLSCTQRSSQCSLDH